LLDVYADDVQVSRRFIYLTKKTFHGLELDCREFLLKMEHMGKTVL
jgi:hypothetical protein